jgi:cytochrome P450
MFCGFFPPRPTQPDGSPLPATPQGWEAVRTLMAHLNNFMLGGYLSTEFLVGNALYLLLERPERMQAYRAADGAGRRRMLAEIARFEAPFQMADRKAVPLDGGHHLVLGGTPIAARDMVTLVYGSANHDEAARFGGAEAEQLDLTRNASFGGANLVFGQGIHRCIGGGIAATVAQQALDTIADLLPTSLRLAPGMQPVRLRNPYFRGFQSLVLQV